MLVSVISSRCQEGATAPSSAVWTAEHKWWDRNVMPTSEDLRQLVDRYAKSVTARDVDALVALFTEDAVQQDPATSPPNVGHEAIRTFFQAAVDASTATTFEALAVHTCGDHAAIDFRVTVQLEAGTMVIEGIEVFSFAEDGRIRSVTAYWDDADLTFPEA
jgi:steroid Delta-isomerase